MDRPLDGSSALHCPSVARRRPWRPPHLPSERDYRWHFTSPLSALTERSKTTRTTDGEIKRRSEQDNAGCKMRGKQCGDTRGNGGRAGAVGLPKVPAHGMGWNPQGRDEGRVDNLVGEEEAAAAAPATEAAAVKGAIHSSPFQDDRQTVSQKRPLLSRGSPRKGGREAGHRLFRLTQIVDYNIARKQNDHVTFSN